MLKEVRKQWSVQGEQGKRRVWLTGQHLTCSLADVLDDKEPVSAWHHLKNAPTAPHKVAARGVLKRDFSRLKSSARVFTREPNSRSGE
jgi:hypothetical protein